MSTTTPDAIEEVIEYLETSSENMDAQVIALNNAADTADVSVEDVLKEYVKRKAVDEMLFRKDKQFVDQLVSKLNNMANIQADVRAEKITNDVEIIATEEDVKDHAISIYTDKGKTVEERQKSIKKLISEAQKKGINVVADEVVRSLRNYKEETEVTIEKPQKDSGIQQFIQSIEGPTETAIEESNEFTVKLSDDDLLSDIDWYVSGAHVGSGKSLVYQFESEGKYTVSAEVGSVVGETATVSKDVNVGKKRVFDVKISGDTVVEKGNTASYSINVSETVTIDTVEWKFNGVPAARTEQFTRTFSDAGEHTLSVSITTTNGQSGSDSISINVVGESEVEVGLGVPEQVYIGEKTQINCFVESGIEEVEKLVCKIDGEIIGEKFDDTLQLDHVFQQKGEYVVTVTGYGENDQSRDTAVKTIFCIAEPSISLESEKDTVVAGEKVSITADTQSSLDISWDVENASLIRVKDSTATIEVHEGFLGNVVVTAEVTNEVGKKKKETVRLPVHEPVVDVLMTVDEPIVSDEPAEFSINKDRVENADITDVRWYLGGKQIGTGETIVHRFPEKGEYTVRVEVETNVGTTDEVEQTIEVIEGTEVTAVALVRGGPTTNDEFILDASKSVTKNVDVEQFKWEVEDIGLQIGEEVNVSFPTAKTYNIDLTIVTEEGIYEQDTVSIEVEEYRNVEASISGPQEVLIGEEITFTASDSEPTNTSIQSYEWYVNDQFVSEGESFTQTFPTGGHYTVRVEVITTTDEEASANHSLVVNQPETEIDASLTVVTDDPVVNTETVLTTENTTVKNGEITRCLWVIDGEEIDKTTQTVRVIFDEYGERPVSVTIETGDQTRDSVTRDVYVSPTVSNPPYKQIDEETEKGDVIEQIINLYKDPALSIEDANRFTAHLILDAHYYDIDLAVEEIESHLGDVVDQDTVIDIDLYAVKPEREYRDLPPRADESWDIAVEDHDIGGQEGKTEVEGDLEYSGEKGQSQTSIEDISWIYDSDKWNVKKYYQTSVEPVVDVDCIGTNIDVSEFVEDEEAESEPEDRELVGEDEQQKAEDIPEGEGITKGEDVVSDATGDSEDEYETIDQDTSLGDEHMQERISPETFDIGESVFAMPNYTQDLIDFEFILEGDEPYVPDGINNAGVVVVEDGELYVAIARVIARDWSIHPAEKKKDIAKGYEQHFLSRLNNPVQIVSVPVQFEMREHIKQINNVLKTKEDDPNELLTNIGRSIYPNWLESFMQENDLKEKEFYIVVPFRAESIAEFKQEETGILSSLKNAPIISNLYEKYFGDDWSSVTRYQCLRELNARMNEIESGLRRIDVKLERVDNKDEALAVLYHYYNGDRPDRDVFPTGPFTKGVKGSDFYGENFEDIGANFTEATEKKDNGEDDLKNNKGE